MSADELDARIATWRSHYEGVGAASRLAATTDSVRTHNLAGLGRQFGFVLKALEAERTKLAAVRELHFKAGCFEDCADDCTSKEPECGHCWTAWPCSTIQALGVEA